MKNREQMAASSHSIKAKWVVIAVVIAITAFCLTAMERQHGESTMKTIHCSALESEMIMSENVTELGANSDLTFEVVPDVIEEDNRFIVNGYLVNSHSQAKEIIVFPLGMMGFCVDFAPSDALTYVGPLFPPPAPPPPMKIVVPAETRVEFTKFIIKETEKPSAEPGTPLPAPSPLSSPDVLSLEDYDYSGSPTVALNWSFCYWGGDRTSGTLSVTLPER